MIRVLGHLRRNVVAYVALFMALGLGTAYAIERNSVKGKHIAADAVAASDIRAGAVGTEEQAEVPSMRLIEAGACSSTGLVPPETDIRIGFAAEDFASGPLISGGCPTEGRGDNRILVREDGLYLVSANIVWGGGPAASRSLKLWNINESSPFAAVLENEGGITGQSVSDVQRLEDGDQVWATVSQDSAEAVSIGPAGALSVVWLGP